MIIIANFVLNYLKMVHMNVKISKIDFVRDVLNDDKIICRYQAGMNIRQQVHELRKNFGVLIYAERCHCNLVKTKHIGYVIDWAN